MKGHTLAWVDPNSTSGYLIPSATLKSKGIKLDDGAYFPRQASRADTNKVSSPC